MLVYMALRIYRGSVFETGSTRNALVLLVYEMYRASAEVYAYWKCIYLGTRTTVVRTVELETLYT